MVVPGNYTTTVLVVESSSGGRMTLLQYLVPVVLPGTRLVPGTGTNG